MAGTKTDDATARCHIVKPPKTDKEKAIIDAAIENPTGTNQEIADRAVELDEGVKRVDPSWASRVRNEFLELVEDEPDTPTHPGATDLDDRVERIEAEIDTLIDSVKTLHETIDRIERRDRAEEINRLESRISELRGETPA